jgi:hypothetical protein
MPARPHAANLRTAVAAGAPHSLLNTAMLVQYQRGIVLHPTGYRGTKSQRTPSSRPDRPAPASYQPLDRGHYSR